MPAAPSETRAFSSLKDLIALATEKRDIKLKTDLETLIRPIRVAPGQFELALEPKEKRDEFYARPTAGPQRLLEQPATVGGSDLQARGTWMGVTRDGFFVGVTNQRTFSLPDRNKRSRVLDLTNPADHDAALELVADADVVLVACNTPAQLAKGAVRELRADGDATRASNGCGALP